VGLAHIRDPVVCDLPGFTRRSDLIILYYCLMATWTGLGNNTELFWAVLSQKPTPPLGRAPAEASLAPRRAGVSAARAVRRPDTPFGPVVRPRPLALVRRRTALGHAAVIPRPSRPI
jgi:hypothetical protein